MAKMNWSISIQLSGTPTITASAAEEIVEGIDQVSVQIAAGDAGKVVQIQPGAATAIRLLVVKSSVYSPNISFVASDGANDSDPVTLDGPQVFTTSSVALFGVDPPTQLKFAYTGAGDAADVDIIVARDATP